MIRHRHISVCRKKMEKFVLDLPWLLTLKLPTPYVVLFILKNIFSDRHCRQRFHTYGHVTLNIVNIEVMLHLLQLKVLAEDGGSPPRSATATVSITVERNLAAPEFTPGRYETEILEV